MRRQLFSRTILPYIETLTGCQSTAVATHTRHLLRPYDYLESRIFANAPRQLFHSTPCSTTSFRTFASSASPEMEPQTAENDTRDAEATSNLTDNHRPSSSSSSLLQTPAGATDRKHALGLKLQKQNFKAEAVYVGMSSVDGIFVSFVYTKRTVTV